jgi:hypothetical protein
MIQSQGRTIYKIRNLETDDEALRGVQLFVQKHGRDYDLMRSTFKSFNQLLDSKEKQAKKMNLSWVKYAAVLAISFRSWILLL